MHEYGYVVNVDCAVVRDTNAGRDADDGRDASDERDTSGESDTNADPRDDPWGVEQPEYLLIRRSERESHAAGVVAFPGGKLEADAGDDRVMAATARREVREETGVRVGAVRYATSTVFETDDGTRVVNVVCVGRYAGGEAHPREPAEVAAVEWRTPAAIREADDVPDYLTAYLDAVEATRRGPASRTQ